MYFREHLPFLIRDDLCKLLECLVTELRMGKKKCLFMCPYRSPSQSSDEFDTFCSNLNLFLSNINDLNPTFSNVIDNFNAGTSKRWSSDKETFSGRAIQALMTSSGYTQLIDQSAHVICNSGIELSLFDKCHHNLIFGELKFMIRLPPTYKRHVWDYKKANAKCIWRSVSKVDQNFLFQGTSLHLMNIFHKFIQDN